MALIPCKICPGCGMYHDATVTACDCGANLKRVAAKPVEETEIPQELYGEIDETLSFYVQKCSGCGAESYTIDPANPVRICFRCNKPRIASVKPVLFVSTPEPEPEPEPDPIAEEEAQEEEKVDRWASVLESTQSAARQLTPEPEEDGGDEADGDDEDDEDDEDIGGWGALLGVTAEPKKPAPKKPEPKPEPKPAAPRVSTITFTALRYGSLSFTLRSDSRELPYMLGREANHGDFLKQDGYVGRRHCEICYEAGNWIVHDNRAANGTAVNGAFLDENGRMLLRDGDELTLGHHPTSMAFRVRIG